MPDRPDKRRRATAPSRMGAGFNVFVSCLALLAIVVMVNYIAMRHPRSLPLSQDRHNPLASVTLQVLKTITNDVDVVIYYDPEAPLFTHVETLLQQYHDVNRHLRVETVDYLRRPGRAEAVRSRYRLGAGLQEAVIFANGDNVKVVRKSDLADYNVDDVVAGKTKTVKRKNFKGEAVFTSALLSVVISERPLVAFLGGYGDYHSPTNMSSDVGYGRFTQLLRDHNASIGAISLTGTNDIPAQVRLLVIPGLQYEVSPEHQAKIDRYLEAGGRLLVLFKYASQCGLERLLYRWGVEVQDRQIVDRSQSDRNDLVVVAGDGYGTHEIVRPLIRGNSPVGFAAPRPVRSITGAAAADAPQVTILAATSSRGVAVADYRNGLNYNEQNDKTGVVPLAAAIEKGGIVGVDGGSTRIVVFGDSHCFDNQMLPVYANTDLAWNTVSWLLDQSLLVGVPPRHVSEFQINLTDKNFARLQWVFLAGIPGAILLLGWMVWLRRQI
jgi:hypothetical protein